MRMCSGVFFIALLVEKLYVIGRCLCLVMLLRTADILRDTLYMRQTIFDFVRKLHGVLSEFCFASCATHMFLDHRDFPLSSP
jgi:hypothetical protein